MTFRVADDDRPEIGIDDLRGARVARIERGLVSAGEWSFEWNLRDAAGARVPPGLHRARLTAQGRRFTRTVTVLP